MGLSETGQREFDQSVDLLRGGPRLPIEVVFAFDHDNRHDFRVEPIKRALKGITAQVVVSSYYALKKRQPSTRARRDHALIVVIRDVYEANNFCYGVRKM